MRTISQKYSDFVLDLRFEDLDRKVVEQTKMLFLDLVGVSLAGLKLMNFPQLVVSYMLELGGKPEATVLHTKTKIPAVNAAFANAACAHAIDMDDGHRFAALHPGTVVIPAALAAAELAGATTQELITGIVAGYEVMIRIGMAIVPSSLNRGFHITGIAGPFGASAAAGKILGLDRARMAGALGLAGLQASGLIQVNHEVEGAKVKPVNPARAATSGLLSAILAQKGAYGPLEIFEGEDGFFKAVTDRVDQDLLLRDLGREFEILRAYLKLYAACRHAHAPIDAVLRLTKENTIDPSEIKEIRVATYPAAVRLAGIAHATTPSAGRFSIPFSAALALIRGDAGAENYSEETLHDQTIQDLADRVKLTVGEKWEKAYPQKRGATVSITGRDGRSWQAEVALAKGEPENPAGWEEIHEKFIGNATRMLSKKDAETLGSRIMNLETSALEEIVALS